MDWERLFEPQILLRGRNYYQEGYVENFHKKDGMLMADIWGTEKYQIKIQIANNRIN